MSQPERLPPQNLDAEESVLGAMMLSPKAVDAVVDMGLEARAFYRESHGVIFTAMVALYAKGAPVDGITVVEELSRTQQLEAAGGADRVHEISALVPAASNVRHWANIVRETWLSRGLARLGRDLLELGMERPGPIEELIAEADDRILELQGLVNRDEGAAASARDLVTRFREKLLNPPDATSGIKTPWSFLRNLQPARVYVLGGYQGFGKTAIARQFIAAACRGGARVGFQSIEMSKEDLMDQFVAMYGVPNDMTTDGVIDASYQQALETGLAEIETWDFEVHDEESITPAIVRKNQRKGKYDLLVIDHLHQFVIKDPRHQREELEQHVRRVTAIAKEFNIPVLLLAQLTRSGDFRNPFPRPTMASLRGSGMIEAEAAAVWFIWRKTDQQHQPGTEAEFIIAKNRFGPLGWQHLQFRPRFVRFDWTPE